MDITNENTGSRNVREKRKTVHLAIWTGLWMATLALAVFGSELLWEHRTLTISAFLLNLGCGIGMIIANIRHLKVLDELMQKIQLEAMGLALGVGVVGGLSLSVLDITDLIAADAEISYLVILIALTYITAVVAGMRRYR